MTRIGKSAAVAAAPRAASGIASRPRLARLSAALATLAIAGGIAFASPASAEFQLGLYGGIQGAASSDIKGTDTDGSHFEFEADWEGKSLTMPPYWGVRATAWMSERWGVSLDFAHAKVYATDGTLVRSGFERLEFTDGLNIATVNALYRIPNKTRFTPYAGLGVGINVPHVETRSPASDRATHEYQFGGPSVQAQIGAEYELSRRWGLFGEYKLNHSWIDVDMAGGGR